MEGITGTIFRCLGQPKDKPKETLNLDDFLSKELKNDFEWSVFPTIETKIINFNKNLKKLSRNGYQDITQLKK